MKDRLTLELEILDRIPGQYPYSWEEALEILTREIADFKPEELTSLWEDVYKRQLQCCAAMYNFYGMQEFQPSILPVANEFLKQPMVCEKGRCV